MNFNGQTALVGWQPRIGTSFGVGTQMFLIAPAAQGLANCDGAGLRKKA